MQLQLGPYRWIRVLLAVLFALSLGASSRAQKSRIEALADQMSASLSHSGQKSVVVFDFDDSGTMDAAGEQLAVEFSAVLAKSARNIRVEDRSRLLELLNKYSLVPGNIGGPDIAIWLLRNSGSDTAVLGTISNGIDGPRLSVEAYRAPDSESIATVEGSIPVTEDLRAHVSGNEKEEGPRPACIYCPRAQYSEEGLKHKVEGVATLEGTVDEEGYVKDISVRIPMPYGLTEQAIETVTRWRLKPATGPDGKPVAVRQEIEVTFMLY
jgi:TonB family protein